MGSNCESIFYAIRPKIKLRYAPGLFLPVGENFRLPPLQQH